MHDPNSKKEAMTVSKQFGVMGIDQIDNAVGQDKELLKGMQREAEQYLSGFHWCKKIRSRYFGSGVGGVFAVFMFEIENMAQAEQDLLWVLVGDLPPAYLIVKGGPENPGEALSVYVELMAEWVDTARQGLSVDELIPVNVPPTSEYADQLASRLAFLRENVLGN